MRNFSVQVRCGNGFHTVVWRDGQLFFPDHEQTLLRRELTLAELGDTSYGCMQLLKQWRDSTHELRSPFKELRQDLKHVRAGRRFVRRRRLQRNDSPNGKHYRRMYELAREVKEARGKKPRARLLWNMLLLELRYRGLVFEEHCDRLDSDDAADRLIELKGAIVRLYVSRPRLLFCVETKERMDPGYPVNDGTFNSRYYETHLTVELEEGAKFTSGHVLSRVLYTVDSIESAHFQLVYELSQDAVADAEIARRLAVVLAERGTAPVTATFRGEETFLRLSAVDPTKYGLGEPNDEHEYNHLWTVPVRGKAALVQAVRELRRLFETLEALKVNSRLLKGLEPSEATRWVAPAVTGATTSP